MRKQTKLVAVLSAAALLAMGASMTSFAATGWVEENGEWVYYDKDGYQVTETWKKSVNNWFYLDEDGVMSTSRLVNEDDNTYYVDENGAMVVNQWVKVENEDSTGADDDDEYNWYYFQANGKAYKASESTATSFKTINGKKYTFDDDGKMLYGWVEGTQRLTDDDAWKTGVYYCGTQDDGAQTIGWKQLPVIDTENKDGDDQDYWFYFKSNGKKVGIDDTATEDTVTKTINGKKYSFEKTTGKMLSEWVDGMATSSVVASSSAVAAPFRYYSSKEDGSRAKGWFKVVPDENLNSTANNDDEAKWYYANNDGTLYNSTIKTINGKKYAFNEMGEMLTGLWALTQENNVITEFKELDSELLIDDYTNNGNNNSDFDKDLASVDVYYFGNDDDGAMKLGSQNVTVDGDTYGYYFAKTGASKGKGYGSKADNNYSMTKLYKEDGTSDGSEQTYIYDQKSMYVHGRKVKADTDMKYEAFTAFGQKISGSDKTVENMKSEGYLINSSGALMRDKKNVKDANDMYYCTNKSGKITYYSADRSK